MQHDSQESNPYLAALSAEQRAVLDNIRSRSIARFGFDAFRMEEGGGDGGGSGNGGDASGAGEQGAAGAGGSAGQAGEQGGQGDDTKADDAKGKAAGKVEDLPDWAQKLIKDTRGEAAENRTKASAAEKKLTEQLDGIAKALGLKQDEAPDPAKLAQQLEQTQTQAKQAAVELAVYKTASKHQGDPDALLDSRGFLAKLADLDLTDAKFAEKVETAIKDAVKDNPKLKAAQAAGSSSADHGAGGTGDGSKSKPKTLTDAVKGHYGT